MIRSDSRCISPLFQGDPATRIVSSNFAAKMKRVRTDRLQVSALSELASSYGVQAATPGVVAGAGGAADPMKMAHVRDVDVLVATAAHPVAVTLDNVTVTFCEGP